MSLWFKKINVVFLAWDSRKYGLTWNNVINENFTHFAAVEKLNTLPLMLNYNSVEKTLSQQGTRIQ